MQYMNDFAARLEGTGEYVDGQALSPEGTFVRYDGEGRLPVTDGPFAETKDLIAGWMVIDVETYERAVELAGELSAAPGPGRQADLRVARATPVPDRRAHRRGVTKDETLLRELIPAVTGVLVRRGADFATAEDAVQEAMIPALATWPQDPPADPKGWLITVAWRKFLDATRTESSRHAREARAGPSHRPARPRHRPTPCSSTSCAPTRRSPRPPRWRSRCGRWAA